MSRRGLQPLGVAVSFFRMLKSFHLLPLRKQFTERIIHYLACRYREAGGSLLWRPHRGGHGIDDASLALALEFFAAVASGARCAMWGEDDTRRVAPREAIDPEFLNPLYNARIAALWRKDAP